MGEQKRRAERMTPADRAVQEMTRKLTDEGRLIEAGWAGLADYRQKALTAEAKIAVIRSLSEHAERELEALKVSMSDERAAAASALATAEQEAARWGSEYTDAMDARMEDAITMERVGAALAVFARIGSSGPEDLPLPEWVAAVTAARTALKEAGLQRLLDPASGTPESEARRRS